MLDIKKLNILKKIETEFKSYALNLGQFDSPEIKRYSNEFDSELPKKISPTSKDDFFGRIENSQIVLFGDFHTLPQNQNLFLDLIKQHCKTSSSNPILCLEMFHIAHQKHVEDYLESNITINCLKNLVNYNRTWGFPFKNFRRILEFAKKNNIKVFGVNSSHDSNESLNLRDRLAGKKIAQLKHEYPDNKIFVLFGEHHLANIHLPNQIRHYMNKHLGYQDVENSNILRIVANVDKYTMQNKRTDGICYGKAFDDLQVIQNCPAWIKWLTFSKWQDLQFQSHETPAIKLTERDSQIEYNFFNLCKNMNCAYDLGLNLDDLTRFSFRDISNQKEVCFPNIEHFHNLALYRARHDGFFYNFSDDTITGSSMGITNILDCIGQYIFTRPLEIDFEKITSTQLFFFNILKSLTGKISSKILNPYSRIEKIQTATTNNKLNNSFNKFSTNVHGENWTELAEQDIKHNFNISIEIADNFFQSISQKGEADSIGFLREITSLRRSIHIENYLCHLKALFSNQSSIKKKIA